MWTDLDKSRADDHEPSERAIRLAGGRVVRATPVFDTYWRFAARRQELFFARLNGSRPWTDDPILAAFRFTNAYRAADRVTQYLLRNVLYEGDQTQEEIFFRAILFKLFNRISTWEHLCEAFGEITWATFDRRRYSAVLESLLKRGERIYSAAYIIPPPMLGAVRKHENHLRLIELMMHANAPKRVAAAESLLSIFELLKGFPSLGDFLAFQFTIDLNYSALANFSEMDFVVAGPGARVGIRKCFADTAGLNDADIIAAVADIAHREFERLGISFRDLWGRPLHLIDFQNLFCEVDKYARVFHPHVKGGSGRSRIKQCFSPNAGPLPQWYPSKLRVQVPLHHAATPPRGCGQTN